MSRIGGHRGYLMVDHRNSPGVPRSVLAAYKREQPDLPAGVQFEADTYTCCHCQRIVVMHPQRSRPREVCRRCMKVVCDAAACQLNCRPFGQLIEQIANGLYRQSPDTGLIVPSKGEPVTRG